MSKPVGFTEVVWAGFSEEYWLLWRIVLRSISIVCGFLAGNSGTPLLDLLSSLMLAALASLLIDGQRNYSKLSPKWRRFTVRSSINLGLTLSVIAVSGTCALIVGMIGIVSLSMLAPEFMKLAPSPLHAVIFYVLAFAGTTYVLFGHVRGYIFEYSYVMPYAYMRDVLVYGKHSANNVFEFLFFEFFITAMILLVYRAAVVAFSGLFDLLKINSWERFEWSMLNSIL
jgi:hypothetical protein